MAEKGELSLYEKVHRHDEELKSHEERISHLEEDHGQRLSNLEMQFKELKNTITSENQETRTTMREQTAKLFGIVEHAMGIQSKREESDHERKMQRLKVFGDISLKLSGVILALASSGGILYLLAEKVFFK